MKRKTITSSISRSGASRAVTFRGYCNRVLRYNGTAYCVLTADYVLPTKEKPDETCSVSVDPHLDCDSILCTGGTDSVGTRADSDRGCRASSASSFWRNDDAADAHS